MDREKALNRMREDEVVQFISERHHISVNALIDCLARQDGSRCENKHCSFCLEDNEKQIIRDLIHLYYKK